MFQKAHQTEMEETIRDMMMVRNATTTYPDTDAEVYTCDIPPGPWSSLLPSLIKTWTVMFTSVNLGFASDNRTQTLG